MRVFVYQGPLTEPSSYGNDEDDENSVTKAGVKELTLRSVDVPGANLITKCNCSGDMAVARMVLGDGRVFKILLQSSDQLYLPQFGADQNKLVVDVDAFSTGCLYIVNDLELKRNVLYAEGGLLLLF